MFAACRGRCDHVPVSEGDMNDYFGELRAFASRLAARFRGTPPPPFEDPPLGVREPRRRGPGGKSSAAAVDEPPERLFVQAHGGNIAPAGIQRKR